MTTPFPKMKNTKLIELRKPAQKYKLITGRAIVLHARNALPQRKVTGDWSYRAVDGAAELTDALMYFPILFELYLIVAVFTWLHQKKKKSKSAKNASS